MPTPKSLFLQVAWNDLFKVQEQLEHVHLYHKQRGTDNYIHNIVLDEIGSEWTGLHFPVLDVIAPYLPGGTRKTFDNVFVGSHFVNGNQPYGKGMLNSEHRWANLRVQKYLWQQFADRYPNVPFHFYINHEGDLAQFQYRDIAAAYEAYLIQSIRDAYTVKDSQAILWSPAISNNQPLNWRSRQGVKRTFKNVQSYTNNRLWVHLQDRLGRKNPPTIQTVVKQYRQLKSMDVFASLRVNMEMFQSEPTYGPAPYWKLAEREAYYKNQGVPLGASWEIRFWRESHGAI